MLLDADGLELLDDAEVWSLLAGQMVGRVGISVAALPAIFPVNYVVDDRAIYFRTSHGTKLSAAVRGAVVAFQADDFDPVRRTGWSVHAVGRAHVVDNPEVEALVHPWVPGEHSYLVRIVPELLTGRRIATLGATH